MSPTEDEVAARPRPWWRRRRWLLILLAGLVVLLWLKQCVVDVRPVVGQSMWPGLEGGRDWILLERDGLFGDDPRRFEVWAIAADQEPAGEEGHILNQDGVKRVLAFGGEMIDFAAGDLFVGPDADHLERGVRPAAVLEAMLIPVFEGWEKDGIDRWRVTEGGLQLRGSDMELKAVNEAPGTPGFLAQLRGGADRPRTGVWDDHRGVAGEWLDGRHMVPDVRIDVTVSAFRAGATLRLRHRVGGGAQGESGGDVREIVLRERGLRVRHRDPSGAWTLLLEQAGFPGTCRIRMETLDGRFRVALLDGEAEVRTLVDTVRETRELVAFDPATDTFRIESQVYLEVDRGAVDLASLDILRDVYYFWPPGLREARDVREGHVFVAGDNMPASSTRQFLDVPRRRLMGRVRRVVWPRSRRLPEVENAPVDPATK